MPKKPNKRYPDFCCFRCGGSGAVDSPFFEERNNLKECRVCEGSGHTTIESVVRQFFSVIGQTPRGFPQVPKKTDKPN
jgi:DnaJ-class molecular chaperone